MADSRPSPPLSAVARRLLSGRALGLAVLLAAATLVLFGVLAPGLDLGAAQVFYRGDNRFVGETPLGEGVRRLLYWTPTAVLLAAGALWAARRFGLRPAARGWAPSGRGLLFLAASLAVGPGLLVNVGLKNHSHRPRPVQVEAFGGTMAFRPAGRFDGACARNCSFVSGEGATGFWMLAPALLGPPAAQPALLAGAAAFGIATGLLRMAFGGHFLSDTILAALLSLMVVVATWWAVFGRPGRVRAKP